MAATGGLINTCTKLSISLSTCSTCMRFSSNHFIQILYLFVHPRFLEYSVIYVLQSIRTAKIQIILFCTNYQNFYSSIFVATVLFFFCQALQNAVRRNNVHEVKVLVARGADVNINGSEGVSICTCSKIYQCYSFGLEVSLISQVPKEGACKLSVKWGSTNINWHIIVCGWGIFSAQDNFCSWLRHMTTHASIISLCLVLDCLDVTYVTLNSIWDKYQGKGEQVSIISASRWKIAMLLTVVAQGYVLSSIVACHTVVRGDYYL